MRRVDKFDQLRESYIIFRRSRMWWFRIFYFVVDAPLVIAYAMNKLALGRRNGDESHLLSNQGVSRYLIQDFSSKKYSITVNYLYKHKGVPGQVIRVPDEVRFTNIGNYFPEGLDSFRRCRLCSTKTNAKRTKIQCSCCKVLLCRVRNPGGTGGISLSPTVIWR